MMRQTEMSLTNADRKTVAEIRRKGLRNAREVNRAHVLWCLDQGVPEVQILAVLGISRTALWRVRLAYLQGGLEWALFDVQRSGRPCKYGADAQARITALACSEPPTGRTRWTTSGLTRAARREQDLSTIGRETVRRILKKTTSSPGAD
jgi:transposase